MEILSSLDTPVEFDERFFRLAPYDRIYMRIFKHVIWQRSRMHAAKTYYRIGIISLSRFESVTALFKPAVNTLNPKM